MIQLRPYQEKVKREIYTSWQSGNACTVGVMPTGAGKTVLMSSIAHDQREPTVIIAHRVELVSQISIALARMGVVHNIIASNSTISFCIAQQIGELGRKFYNTNAHVTVAAVDTINARAGSLVQWAARIKIWMIDEAHHVLTANKWGKAVAMFGNARGLGVTATPVRADRKSLHVEQGGVFSDMIVGPSMRDLINLGSLCDYRIFAPKNSIDLTNLKIGSTGDYSQPGLRDAAHKSQIVGDVVASYKTHATGLRGITFTVDVAQAVELAQAFNAAGVPAMAVSAKTPDAVRADAVKKLRDGKVLQLVNVDLFGEGFDVPAVEVVSMARPTMSYGLFAQQFGRALRPLDGKSHGIIIDHVNNIRHGLPDAPRQWTLWNEERGKRKQRDEQIIPLTTCTECFAAYERFHTKCPFCGHKPVPEGRSLPEQVDGDLAELDPKVLAQMRGEIDKIDGDATIPYGAEPVVVNSVEKRHRERKEAQADLRETMAIWAGVCRDRGDTKSQRYRRFFHRFGTDVMTAQTLGARAAQELSQKIKESDEWVKS